MNHENNKGSGTSALPLGMCLGLSVGTAIGAATKNIGLWMPLGISFGMCLSLLLGHKKSGDDTDDET